MAVWWAGRQVLARLNPRVERALDEAAHLWLWAANATIPHDTGHMMRTGRVVRLRPGLRAISYDTPYAVRQHEDVRLRHARGRRARWLALAGQEQRRKILGHIAKAVEGGLR